MLSPPTSGVWGQHDLVAGLVLAAILLPQGIAYAELAGDVTAADMLERLDTQLNAISIQMALVELATRLHDPVYDFRLVATLDRDHFSDILDEAIAEIDAIGDQDSAR